MQIIDTLGKLCPAPLIITKRAIKDAIIGSQFKVLCDNETAKNNLITYINELGFNAVCSEHSGVFEIVFTIENKSTKDVNVNKFCSTNGYSVVIKSRLMGGGDEKLGEMLMRAFINSLLDSELLPSNIVLYNEGVKVALVGCDTAESLKNLNDLGVSIIVCGTCVDFYGVKNNLAVGAISNMYKITEILSQSSHVIYP